MSAGAMQKATQGPACTVCSHPDSEALAAALTTGERVADIAARFGVSTDAVYRHNRRHAPLAVLTLDTENSALPLVARLERILNAAQAASERAYTAGDLRLGGVLGDHAVRAANALVALGVTDEKVRADIAAADAHRRRARALAQAVEIVLESHPEIVEPLADAAERVGGLDEIVRTLRTPDTEKEH